MIEGTEGNWVQVDVRSGGGDVVDEVVLLAAGIRRRW